MTGRKLTRPQERALLAIAGARTSHGAHVSNGTLAATDLADARVYWQTAGHLAVLGLVELHTFGSWARLTDEGRVAAAALAGPVGV